MRLNKYVLFIVLFIVSISLIAQTKQDLKNQKIEIEKEIIYASELLNKTKSSKKKSLNYLRVLESQINSKEKLLIALNIEISLLKKQIQKTEHSIVFTQELIFSQEEDIKNLKAEYSKMIYAAFRKKAAKNNLIFIISADDFNQAYKRVLYLRQYSEFRRNQALKIQQGRMELLKKNEKLAQQKDMLIEESSIKRLLVISKKNELVSVNSTKNEKQELVKKLSKSEGFFKKQILSKNKKANELDNKIRKIIEEEIRKSKDKITNKNGDASFNLTPEALALSSGFINNKGKLPWPLQKGIIVAAYGKQKHPVFAGVETFNNGIDIATDKNTEVRVVFDGIVSRIFFIKGEGKAILINHGEYFSVYSGLREVLVKTGDKLFSKEKIGVVITKEDDNKTELHFEIWKGYEKKDPSNWLYKAY